MHRLPDDGSVVVAGTPAWLEHRVTELEQLPARIDDLTSQVSQLRIKMSAEFSAVRAELSELGDRLDTRMRVLHEDVIARIALLQDGLTPAKRKSRKKINVAVAEKVLALRTEDYFAERSRRGDVPKALRIPKRTGAGNPPVEGDELPVETARSARKKR